MAYIEDFGNLKDGVIFDIIDPVGKRSGRYPESLMKIRHDMAEKKFVPSWGVRFGGRGWGWGLELGVGVGFSVTLRIGLSRSKSQNYFLFERDGGFPILTQENPNSSWTQLKD